MNKANNKQQKPQNNKQKDGVKGKDNKKRQDKHQRKKGAPKWKNIMQEVETLKKRIENEVPPPGVLYYKYKAKSAEENDKTIEETNNSRQIANRQVVETDDKNKIKIRFSDLPISKTTISGLFKSKFVKMTEVQRAAIPHSIKGRDIVCCARTGSGKTLSYLIPAVERLFIERWSTFDGLGVLIIVPVRELAIQSFEVLRSFGGMHDLSAGLLIGGKNLKFEQERIKNMNILVCTPGRLLQHMNESEGFDASNLKLLIIDEVDRILDMGFKESIDQIVRNLPQNVQKMMYSATIGKQIKEIARINLKPDYEYVCLHDFDSIESLANDYVANGEDKALTDQLKSITPVKLLHHYMVMNIEEKLDTLFSFLKSHQKIKCIVFFSSCKEVRFAYETFRRLKIGVQLLELQGRQKQSKRTAIYYEFMERKQAVLFCTDIASRGIDFPAVDWVVQFDCPEDIYGYIHRVGRTARYKSKGNSLLFLTQSEQKFVEKIEKRNITMKKLNVNPNKSLTIQPTLQKLNAENRDIKHLAEKACISYIKSIYLMKDKEVFKFKELDVEKLAFSLGLGTTPQINFIKKSDKNEPRATNEDGEDKPKLSKLQKLRQKIKEKKEQAKVEKSKGKEIDEGDDEVVEGEEDEDMDKESEGDDVEGSDIEDGDESDQDDSYGSEIDHSSYYKENDSDEPEDDESDGEFFKSKKNQREIASEDEEDKKEEEDMKQDLLKVSKKKLRKITKDGPLQGKNKMFFGPNGKVISSLEYHLQEDQKKKEAKDVEESDEDDEEQDDKDLQILAENDVEIESDAEEKFIKNVQKKLKKSDVQDKQLARQKLTEMRLKKKRKLRQQKGIYDDEENQDDQDGGYEVTLGDAQEEQDDVDQESEEEEIVIQPKKKKQKQEEVDKQDKKKSKNKKKVKINEDMNEEELALALLSKDNDF